MQRATINTSLPWGVVQLKWKEKWPGLTWIWWNDPKRNLIVYMFEYDGFLIFDGFSFPPESTSP